MWAASGAGRRLSWQEASSLCFSNLAAGELADNPIQAGAVVPSGGQSSPWTSGPRAPPRNAGAAARLTA
eukprot:12622118-Alexandrium_andersonii.AAC.1